MKIAGYETHPAADVFPLLDSDAFEALKQDISKHGLREPIWHHNSKILDGRNRLMACDQLGIEPPFRCYEGDSPAAFVISLNLHRRHLTPSQAAAAAVEMLPVFEEEARARQGTRTDLTSAPRGAEVRRSHNDVAEQFNVSGRTVQRAKRVAEQSPELFGMVKEGLLDVANAEKAIKKLDGEQRADFADRVMAGCPAPLAIRQTERETAATVIRNEPAPLPAGPFRVLVADPPWQYTKRKDDGTHRSALTYPDMTTPEICALPVGDMAHDDSVLWLWTTNAHMRDAYDVLDAWGFTPKTILTWAKNKMGTGDWLRGKTEHCILAVRGRPTVVLTNQTTLLPGDVREHSRKPDEFYALVEALCPGSKVELFCRQPRDGWQAWGAEAEKFVAAE